MVLRIAHRGGAFYAPEDTMAAFKAAIKRGTRIIELDVQLTKDRIPVVIHDDEIDRTTNGSGKVNNLSFAQIKKLEAGNGERIPSLDESLRLIKKAKCEVFIEIKEEGTEKEILNVVKKCRMEKNSVIISFNEDSLIIAKELIPKIRTAWLAKKLPHDFLQRLSRMDAFAVGIRYSGFNHLNRKKVVTLHKNKYKVFVWTVDKVKDISRMKKLGVDGIISNREDLV